MPSSLCERLGYSAESRLLIVNADDFGMCHAENCATIDGLGAGAYTSSTIMVPCPWFDEAAAHARAHPDTDLGVHLTQTSEWETYKWGPVAGRSSVPSLVDKNGHFFPTVRDVYDRASLADVERESRAQIEQALAAGIDVTHIDSHMGTMQLDPAYHELYVNVAADYRLPLRMVPRKLLARMGYDGALHLLDDRGVLGPDFFLIDGPPQPEATAEYWTNVFRNLRPGVTEIYLHAGYDEPELRACCPAWQQRVADHAFFTAEQTQATLASLGVVRIGYRALREAQRAG